MTFRGHVRDGAARLRLSLPGRDGDSVTIEFILDTGFEGEFALPQDVISRLDVLPLDRRPILLADGTMRYRSYYEIFIDDEDEGEPRRTEIVELDGRPLLGMDLLADSFVQIEVTDGGEVNVVHFSVVPVSGAPRGTMKHGYPTPEEATAPCQSTPLFTVRWASPIANMR